MVGKCSESSEAWGPAFRTAFKHCPLLFLGVSCSPGAPRVAGAERRIAGCELFQAPTGPEQGTCINFKKLVIPEELII